MIKGPINKKSVEAIKALEGIYRKTLAYNDKVMLCHFTLEKEAVIPLHDHEAHQIGYIISGKIKFKTETRGDFIAREGDSYVFDAWEKHGAEILETAEVIEIFSPTRDDYK
ncbi:MAG: cupin domain-containing protein [Promethearchaeota archaeon]|nr:MAG: cupin domain-containing protein [Candidatus Lokiarchaeota archaeon]